MKKQKIVICSSASFEKEIIELKEKLEKMDFEVIKYPIKLKGDIAIGYEKEFSDHYTAILNSDAIVVLNIEKRGIPGYIGPGVFAEMGFTIGLNRSLEKNISVYYINPLPENLPYSEELNLWKKLNWIEILPHNKRISH
ncbi:MAG: hypothetical protein PHI91_03315 [Candidatus Pacebacteria bacterium]|nr:hypothetical protein [Candidatus Paceibacterota bacterium]MDD3970189.1 hypothetical protein [Candidatus Paceibacterota bacterium]